MYKNNMQKSGKQPSTHDMSIAVLYLGIGHLLFESLHDSRPMLGAGSSSGVELFQVFMGTRLWQDRADQQVFHDLFIPTFACCLSILVESHLELGMKPGYIKYSFARMNTMRRHCVTKLELGQIVMIVF